AGGGQWQRLAGPGRHAKVLLNAVVVRRREQSVEIRRIRSGGVQLRDLQVAVQVREYIRPDVAARGVVPDAAIGADEQVLRLLVDVEGVVEVGGLGRSEEHTSE